MHAWEPRAGTLCAPENEGLHGEVIAACRRAQGERYGDVYYSGEVQALVESINSRTELLAVSMIERGIIPRSPYVCRVAGCECSYPKTEADAFAQYKRKKRAA